MNIGHLWLIAFMTLFAGTVQGQQTVSVVGSETVIYDSERDGCTKDDISDAPMRAVRLSNGDLLASGAWATNRLLRGKDFYSLKKQCSQATISARNPNPEAFNDWTWLMSFWTDNGSTIHALAHEEYQGHRYPGKCESGKQMLCTYQAVNAFRSDDEGRTFSRVGKWPIAASRGRYDSAANRMTGFRHPSNIVRYEGFYYAIIETTAEQEQQGGNCLFRTADITDPDAWTYLTKSGWHSSSFNPYDDTVAPPPCDRLSRLSGIVWSVLRRNADGQFIALITTRSKQPNRVDLALSSSLDLKTWTDPVSFYTIVAAWNADCGQPYRYNYPSLIDPSSSSKSFETISSEGMLFMSRIQMKGCSQTMHRDAVAYPLHIEWNR
jgi:hypothetical protein